jgi:hypothetical protein
MISTGRGGMCEARGREVPVICVEGFDLIGWVLWKDSVEDGTIDWGLGVFG